MKNLYKPRIIFNDRLQAYLIVSFMPFGYTLINNYEAECKNLNMEKSAYFLALKKYGAINFCSKSQPNYMFKSIAQADKFVEDYYMPLYLVQVLLKNA